MYVSNFRVIIGCQHGDFFASLFHFEKSVGSDFPAVFCKVGHGFLFYKGVLFSIATKVELSGENHTFAVHP